MSLHAMCVCVRARARARGGGPYMKLLSNIIMDDCARQSMHVRMKGSTANYTACTLVALVPRHGRLVCIQKRLLGRADSSVCSMWTQITWRAEAGSAIRVASAGNPDPNVVIDVTVRCRSGLRAAPGPKPALVRVQRPKQEPRCGRRERERETRRESLGEIY